MSNFFVRAWQRYRSRKRVRGVVVDFLFLVALIVALVPPLRRGFMTYAVRAVLTQPRPYDKIVFLGAEDALRLSTPHGSDTTVSFPPSRPLLMCFGSVWSAQTRAGLSSIAKSAQKYQASLDFFFITSDAPEDVDDYFNRRGYTSLRPLFFKCSDAEPESEADGFVGQLAMSVPSSALIGVDGRVIVKKLGATRWYGATADAAFAIALDAEER